MKITRKLIWKTFKPTKVNIVYIFFYKKKIFFNPIKNFKVQLLKIWVWTKELLKI